VSLLLLKTLHAPKMLPNPGHWFLSITLIRELQCIPLRTSCTVPSRSSVLCCVSSPSTGILKVMCKHSPDWSALLTKECRHSSECRHLLVHDLDWSWMPFAMHQLDRVEQEHDKQGPRIL